MLGAIGIMKGTGWYLARGGGDDVGPSYLFIFNPVFPSKGGESFMKGRFYKHCDIC